MQEIQAVTLFGSGTYSGTIVHAQPCQEYDIENPILVFPDGHVRYYETIIFAARKNKGKLAIILEKGGQNCHTLVTMRERKGIIILHLPNALNLLPSQTKVIVNADEGRISIIEK